MNNKELIAAIASKMNLTNAETGSLAEAFVESVREELKEGNSVGLQGVGVFDVRKRNERVFVHPKTKARVLLPPRLVVRFKQSQVLKEKLNLE